MKTYLYRASNLKSTITFLAQFHSRSQVLAPTKSLTDGVLADAILIPPRPLIKRR